jgi:hypothetical protein
MHLLSRKESVDKAIDFAKAKPHPYKAPGFSSSSDRVACVTCGQPQNDVMHIALKDEESPFHWS